MARLSLWAFGLVLFATGAIAVRFKQGVEELSDEDVELGGDCQTRCGATTFEYPVSDGRTIEFGIGNGSRITYSPMMGECLSHCQAVDYTVGMVKCRSLHRNSIKVSKASYGNETVSTKKNKDQYKLCCVPKPCNYVPEDDTYTPHKTGEVPYYLPLKSLKGRASLSKRACTCCAESDVPSGRNMVDKCMAAYDSGTLATAGKAVLNLFTLGIQGWLSRRGCEEYCSHYKGYKHGKFLWRWTSLAAYQLEGGLNSGGSPPQTGDNAEDVDESAKGDIAKGA